MNTSSKAPRTITAINAFDMTKIDANRIDANRIDANGSGSRGEIRPFKSASGGFAALEVSFELIAALRDVLPVIKKSDADLADQIQRAASSVALNVAEGQASMKGNRLRHYSIAHGSANEVKAGLFVAKAWGWIDENERTRAAFTVLDRLLGLLWGITRK